MVKTFYCLCLLLCALPARPQPYSGVLNVLMNLFPLPNGEVLATVSGAETATVSPSSPPPLLSVSYNLMAERGGLRNGVQFLLADPRLHLWGAGTDWRQGFTLEEWDGERWHSHLAPKSVSPVIRILACDTQGRIWLESQIWTPPALPREGIVIYDPAQDTWKDYLSSSAALEAAAPLGITLQLVPNSSLAAALSGDGWAANGGNGLISLYDGKTWRRWKTSEIGKGSSDGVGFIVPELRRGGFLKIHLYSGPWIWTPSNGWQKADADAPTPTLPPNGPSEIPVWKYYTLPTDSTGAGWINWQGTVYKTRQGRWAKIDALSEFGSPFRDGRNITAIYTDRRGRLFFQTQPDIHSSRYELVAWLPPVSAAPPAPRIQVIPLAIDSVALRFTPPLRSAHWLLWRLNGGAWSQPLKTNAVTLTDLPQGDYRVEAQTLDPLLQVSAQPSVAVFAIHSASSNQVACWVQTLLSGTDDARESAASGLRKQGISALPALQAARPGASEAGRWWIDAVIEEVQQAKAWANSGILVP